jgi:hypothetical protein
MMYCNSQVNRDILIALYFDVRIVHMVQFIVQTNNKAQTALFKDPVRTAL